MFRRCLKQASEEIEGHRCALYCEEIDDGGDVQHHVAVVLQSEHRVEKILYLGGGDELFIRKIFPRQLIALEDQSQREEFFRVVEKRKDDVLVHINDGFALSDDVIINFLKGMPVNKNRRLY